QKGTTLVQCIATDAAGNQTVSGFNVIVVDGEAPVIKAVTATPKILWPPNNQMVAVGIQVQAADNCGGVHSKIISVASDEPVVAPGPDWVITGDLTLQLRAARLNTGVGRHYTIGIQCTDDAGNTAVGSVVVTVPHDKH